MTINEADKRAFERAFGTLMDLANSGIAEHEPIHYAQTMRRYVEALEGTTKRTSDELTRYRERVAVLVSRIERIEVLHSAMAGVLQTKHTSMPPAPAELIYNGANVSSHDRDQALEAARAPTPTGWDRALYADARRDPEGVAAWHSIVARHDRDLAAQRERAAVLEFLAREARTAEASNGAQADCIRALWLAIDAGEHTSKLTTLEPGERA